MTRRGGGASPAQIDREWPYQVALPDDLCVDRNYTIISRFLQARGFSCKTRAVRRSGLTESTRTGVFIALLIARLRRPFLITSEV